MSSSYGETFASVYDEWYPDDGRAAAVVAALGTPPAAGRLLELGAGTGTLALPLARAGWVVDAMDNSPTMLDRLTARGEEAPSGRLIAVGGDAGDPSTWPPGPFEVVLAAWNLVANLVGEEELAGCFRGGAAALGPSGVMVVEADVADLPPRRERHAGGAAARGVRVHTDADPATGIVSGCHVTHELGRLRRRPWTIRLRDPEELDRSARDSGLVVVRRDADWRSTAFTAGVDRRHVTWYRRAVSPPPAARRGADPR